MSSAGMASAEQSSRGKMNRAPQNSRIIPAIPLSLSRPANSKRALDQHSGRTTPSSPAKQSGNDAAVKTKPVALIPAITQSDAVSSDVVSTAGTKDDELETPPTTSGNESPSSESITAEPPNSESNFGTTSTSTAASSFSQSTTDQPAVKTVSKSLPHRASNSITFGGFPDPTNASQAPAASSVVMATPSFSQGTAQQYSAGSIQPPHPNSPGQVHDTSGRGGPPQLHHGASNAVPDNSYRAFPLGANQPWPQRAAQLPHRSAHMLNGMTSPSYVLNNSNTSTSPSPTAALFQANGTMSPMGRGPSPFAPNNYGHFPSRPMHHRAESPAHHGADRRHSGVGGPGSDPSGAPLPTDESALEMRHFILGQFGHASFSDITLEVTFASPQLKPLILPAHSLILARSISLGHALKKQRQAGTGPGESSSLRVNLSDRFINGFAFSDALRHLYGARLLDPRSATSGIDGTDVERQFGFALAYAASGFFLQIDSVIIRGLEIATQLLQWRTLEHALAFGLYGGLDASWGSKPGSVQSSNTSGGTTSPDGMSASNSSPAYGPYSAQFLQRIIDFIVFAFPKDFLVPAQELLPSEGVAFTTRGAPTALSHKPRLSQIRFGERTTEVPQVVSPAHTSLSRVLITLPFPVFKRILEHRGLGERLGWAHVGPLMRTLVSLRAHTGQLPDDGNASFSRGIVEVVKTTTEHPAGCVLQVVSGISANGHGA